MNSPLDIRKKMRNKRRLLSDACRARAAQHAARNAASLRRFMAARRIAFYLAADGELDPLPLLELACFMGKHCYLPVLHPIGHRRLWFAAWKPGDELQPNRFNIPEPVWTPSSLIKPWALDLVITPLVAFDSKGNRMGMGGGYYDRSFAWRRNRQHWTGPMLIGYAYELQKTRRLHKRSWDIAMDAIVTENTLYIG
ncbi:5-formyltetrahydrofolate cyclo-ligase [Thiolapillus sp.]